MPGRLVATTWRYDEPTEISVSDEARTYVMARGGTLYLRSKRSQCCHGALDFLDATTTPPDDAGSFEQVSGSGPEVRLYNSGIGFPASIGVELRGRIRPHLVALWDGCAYRL